MISDDEQDDQERSTTPEDRVEKKKRRLQGACDSCRRKKVRCDRARMSSKQCTNCIAFGSICSHTPRTKSKTAQAAYINLVEQRLLKMELLLRSQLASANDVKPVQPDTSVIAAPLNPFKLTPSPPSNSPPAHIPSLSQSPEASGPSDEPDEDLAHVELAEHLSRMAIKVSEDRFFGKSSTLMLVKHALNMKETLDDRPYNENASNKRPIYWTLRPWEQGYTDSEERRYIYPPDDLLFNLVERYFAKVHPYAPVLHRPTFLRSLQSSLHLRDSHFGATLLMVCAVASRYSDDPRVLVDGRSELSSGWGYFQQIPTLSRSFLRPPSVYDVQYYALASLYLLGCSIPHAAWCMIGLGLRFSQERGAHRRKPPEHRWTAEEELWKRAFWVLLWMDRTTSAFLGRPSGIQDEDFDTEWLVECDDEYWEISDGFVTFHQPQNKPSIYAFANAQYKLCEVLSFTLRTLYSTKKSKILMGLVGEQWEERIIAELDSSLNQWMDFIPAHLRWDSAPADPVFYHQSALLQIFFYHVQMQAHRPFLQRPGPLSFSSLIICTNAARSCSHILHLQAQKAVMGLPLIQTSAFTCGVILVLNVYRNMKITPSADNSREMSNVQKCLNILKLHETRYHLAGRFWDLLSELCTGRFRTGPTLNSTESALATRTSNLNSQTHTAPPGVTSDIIVPIPQRLYEPLVLPTDVYPTQEGLNDDGAQQPALDPNTLFFNDAFLPPALGFGGGGGGGGGYGGLDAAGSSQYQYDDTSQVNPGVDFEAMNLWLNMPNGFNLEEWNNFVATVSATNDVNFSLQA